MAKPPRNRRAQDINLINKDKIDRRLASLEADRKRDHAFIKAFVSLVKLHAYSRYP